VRRGREQQIEAVAVLVRPLLERSGAAGASDRTARFLGHLVVALAEGGARALLNEPDRWTPESLGLALGRVAASGQGALG
jgi:hypothetical protein